MKTESEKQSQNPTGQTTDKTPDTTTRQTPCEWTVRDQLRTAAHNLTTTGQGEQLLIVILDLVTQLDSATATDRASTERLLSAIVRGWPLSTWAAAQDAIDSLAVF